MQTYKVEWSMDFDANNAKEAAEKAYAYMTKPGMSADCFDVYSEDGECVRITVGDDEEEAEYEDDDTACIQCGLRAGVHRVGCSA